jgi:16S rRNA (cytosine1402-N4)-methyltransferase
MTLAPSHTPVLLEETMRYLSVREGGTYIDCTTGLGGHSERIAEAMGTAGRLLCIDQDREALEFADETDGVWEVPPVHGTSAIRRHGRREGIDRADGSSDPGVSSLQFGAPNGFCSARRAADMRMDQRTPGLTAEINEWMRPISRTSSGGMAKSAHRAASPPPSPRCPQDDGLPEPSSRLWGA